MKRTKPASSPFLVACKKEFRFLGRKYGFVVYLEDPAENKIVYENGTTAVIIELDNHEQSVAIFLGRKDRKITARLDSWCYDLGDIVVPQEPALDGEYQKYTSNWNRVLKRSALHMRKYAADVLMGKFSSFRLAQAEVNKRTKEYQGWLRS